MNIIGIVIIVVLFTAAGYAAGWHARRKEVMAWVMECDRRVYAVTKDTTIGPPRIVGKQPPPIGWPFKEDDHG